MLLDQPQPNPDQSWVGFTGSIHLKRDIELGTFVHCGEESIVFNQVLKDICESIALKNYALIHPNLDLFKLPNPPVLRTLSCLHSRPTMLSAHTV
jgi:hypothetical protein